MTSEAGDGKDSARSGRADATVVAAKWAAVAAVAAAFVGVFGPIGAAMVERSGGAGPPPTTSLPATSAPATTTTRPPTTTSARVSTTSQTPSTPHTPTTSTTKGPPPVVVPDVIGWNEYEVYDVLKEAGLVLVNCADDRTDCDPYEEGTSTRGHYLVSVRQSPEAGLSFLAALR
jgi:hypothetical protein